MVGWVRTVRHTSHPNSYLIEMVAVETCPALNNSQPTSCSVRTVLLVTGGGIVAGGSVQLSSMSIAFPRISSYRANWDPFSIFQPLQYYQEPITSGRAALSTFTHSLVHPTPRLQH